MKSAATFTKIDHDLIAPHKLNPTRDFKNGDKEQASFGRRNIISKM